MQRAKAKDKGRAQGSGRTSKEKGKGRPQKNHLGGSSRCSQHKSLRSSQSRIHWTSRVEEKRGVTETETGIECGIETGHWRRTGTKRKDMDWERPC
jgi:hypothetical protein